MVVTSHTPGPWRITRAHRSPCSIEAVSRPGDALAKVYLTDADTHKRTSEALANAYLFAAAPDLFEALQAVEKDPGVSQLSIPTLRSIVAAIDKARGITE